MCQWKPKSHLNRHSNKSFFANSINQAHIPRNLRESQCILMILARNLRFLQISVKPSRLQKLSQTVEENVRLSVAVVCELKKLTSENSKFIRTPFRRDFLKLLYLIKIFNFNFLTLINGFLTFSMVFLTVKSYYYFK